MKNWRLPHSPQARSRPFFNFQFSIFNSSIAYGANAPAGTLPASQADFSAQATIKTVKLKALSAGSNIAAFAMNNVTLGTVESVAAPRFGVASQQIKSLTATVSSGAVHA